MLGAFIKCIDEQMARKGFGPKRTEELKSRFLGLAEYYKAQGAHDAEVQALSRAFAELHQEKADKAKLAMSDLLKNLERTDNFAKFNRNNALIGKTNENVNDGRVAVAFLEKDQRAQFTGYYTYVENYKGALWSFMSDWVNKADKGAFGVQRGKAHLENVIREVKGEATGDATAKTLAQGLKKATDAAVDLFNQAGGIRKKLDDWTLPQKPAVGKLLNNEEKFMEMYMRPGFLDWGRMTHWDGRPIKPEEREKFLRSVYKKYLLGDEIDATAFAQGKALGRTQDLHRVVHFANADAWLTAHKEFGDGNIFDVVANYINTQAHEIALIRAFGSNPEAGLRQVRNLALIEARKKGAKAVAETEATLQKTYDKMVVRILNQNPMDINDWKANSIVGLGNTLTSAFLGSASLLAVVTDSTTSAITKFAQGQNPFSGVKTYLDGVLTDRAGVREMAAQTGFIMDSNIHSIYGATRFTGFNTYGPQWTRRVADTTLRASLMNIHTDSARFSGQSEMMGMFARYKAEPYDALPFQQVLRRHGITAADWDALRALPEWEPRPGAKFIRPLDFMQSKRSDASELFHKWQAFITDEVNLMVPKSSEEARVMLTGIERPDTLAGALLYSFAMFKNFPLTLLNIHGRTAMSQTTRGGRLAYLAGTAATLTLAGALGTQMREIVKGRDPLPMNTPSFFGKAMLAGGGLGIWGDFLFSHINEYGRSPASAFAGPLAGWLGDTTQLAFGDPFKFAQAMDGLHVNGELKAPAKAVEYFRRYTPGASIWYARALLERQFFDRMAELADPLAHRKFRRKEERRQKDFGVGHFYMPGERWPDRGPDFRGMWR